MRSQSKKLPLISNIQRFSVDDGPGIRTTVFFKGCNLSCLWCHNPECISPSFSLLFLGNSCSNCGLCAGACGEEVHSFEDGRHILKRELCQTCGKCVDACRKGALSLIGKYYQVDELMDILKKDAPYYQRSGGGVTFSGGEPMLFTGYLVDILRECKKAGFHTAIDTAGNVDYSRFEEVTPLSDLFLYDIKLYNSERHQAVTGVPNRRILDNLIKLSLEGCNIIIRTPVIPGINTDRDELAAIADFIAFLPRPVELVQLLPYHSYGSGKYDSLGLTNHCQDFTTPEQELMAEALDIFQSRGVNATIS